MYVDTKIGLDTSEFRQSWEAFFRNGESIYFSTWFKFPLEMMQHALRMFMEGHTDWNIISGCAINEGKWDSIRCNQPVSQPNNLLVVAKCSIQCKQTLSPFRDICVWDYLLSQGQEIKYDSIVI
jgi:hypothetical protein